MTLNRNWSVKVRDRGWGNGDSLTLGFKREDLRNVNGWEIE
jgi:hypothetical protein